MDHVVRQPQRASVLHVQARDGADDGVQDSILEGVQCGVPCATGVADAPTPTPTSTASAKRPAACPGDLVALYAARSSETPQVFKVVRVGAGGDLVVVAHAKPTHAAARKARPNATQASRAHAPTPEQVVPHDLVLRELPAARPKFPCALALPRVVLLTQKHAAPHHVQVHNGTPFLSSGYPFKLRDEGVRWAYASP